MKDQDEVAWLDLVIILCMGPPAFQLHGRIVIKRGVQGKKETKEKVQD